ncbi:MAG: lactate utilization protein [Desulfobacteraceae bacterium]|nr:lactate utilization protein [Desulfobacteraceae bacterium]
MSKPNSRSNILSRLHKAVRTAPVWPPGPSTWKPARLTPQERIDQFKELMTAGRSEVYPVKGDEWVPLLKKLLQERGIKTLTYGQDTEIGKALATEWNTNGGSTRLIPWSNEIETFRDELFEIDAGITSTIGGIADGAALILWPTPEEPRLLSLVPPVHFALVKADTIFSSFSEAIEKLNWAKKAPTNSLLISGPSRTADIEMILQFGVHGPTDLIVLVVE